MKRLILLVCILLVQFEAMGQKLYGIVRKNFYTIVTNPLDSTSNPYERFDSSTIRLGELNTTNGFISNISQDQYNDLVNLTGAALNPFENTFLFVGQNSLNTLSLSNGEITNRATITNAMASSYFDNFRFNHSDSTLYGLARRVIYNPNTFTYTGEVYLAKIDSKTGKIMQISTNSIVQGYALAGSAIDPYQMVYYFSTGAHLIGLDLYSGNVYSKSEINIPGGGIFDNFSYSCADNSLYGLVRKNYFTYYPDPFNPTDSFAQFDSSTVKLARINPNTGLVNILSPYAVTKGGYSLNAGSAIDPQTMTFFYNPGNSIVGVSLLSGLKTSEQTLSFENGDYFDLMRNFENCRTASAKRLANSNFEIENQLQLQIYPNPAEGMIQIEFEQKGFYEIGLMDLNGKILQTVNTHTKNVTVDGSGLKDGVYILKIKSGTQETIRRLIIAH
jgi:hypothetical protein